MSSSKVIWYTHWMTHRARALLPHMSFFPLLSEHKPCGDLRPHLSGALAGPRPFTGCEPKQLTENQDHRHVTEDKQHTEHEDLRVKPLSFQQPIAASIYDSAGRIITNVNSTSLNRGVNSAQSAHFRAERLRNNQIKGRIRVVTKVQQQQ